jgi:hypothetical protein
MSGVLMRKRSVSEMEFWKNGGDIRAAVTRFLMNENTVPKRWRPVFTFPGVALARRLIEEITAANTIYPTTDAELEQRRARQTAAIIICEQIIQHLQWICDTLPVRIVSVKDMTEMLNKEVALLKAWRKQNKIFAHKRE